MLKLYTFLAVVCEKRWLDWNRTPLGVFLIFMLKSAYGGKSKKANDEIHECEGGRIIYVAPVE